MEKKIRVAAPALYCTRPRDGGGELRERTAVRSVAVRSVAVEGMFRAGSDGIHT